MILSRRIVRSSRTRDKRGGTYSVLNPKIAYELRDRKLANLAEMKPETIVSANIGCITHLQSGTGTPVQHWVELLDEALTG
jgi:glycolate oxidase iron-sulfur subunit